MQSVESMAATSGSEFVPDSIRGQGRALAVVQPPIALLNALTRERSKRRGQQGLENGPPRAKCSATCQREERRGRGRHDSARYFYISVKLKSRFRSPAHGFVPVEEQDRARGQDRTVAAVKSRVTLTAAGRRRKALKRISRRAARNLFTQGRGRTAAQPPLRFFGRLQSRRCPGGFL